MNYQETLTYLYNRLPVFQHVGASAYKPGLENTQRLLDALGNPHLRLKTIHVAGTNGKGSVSHMLSAILQSAGYKTGLYTSPHLVDFGERIRIDGQMIDSGYVVRFVEQYSSLFDEVQPSFFEATMAMAFCYFADMGVDVAVIEVGLGGRLDSTNVIVPALSVITNISFDHVGFLGDTLEKIAYEKAGIIKSGVPVIIGESSSETRDVFVSKARKEVAPIIFAEDCYQLTAEAYEKGKMKVRVSDGRNYWFGLGGKYQLKNGATLLCALDKLIESGYYISAEAITDGLSRVVELTGLQGRWQVYCEHPLMVLDTGHNKAGIALVVEQIMSCPYEQLHVVIGMVNDKDISAVLQLLPTNAVYYFCRASIARALDASELQQQAADFGLTGLAYQSVAEALQVAQANVGEGDMLYIGGSNFVVGEALEFLSRAEGML